MMVTGCGGHRHLETPKNRIKDQALELTLHLALPIVGCALGHFADQRAYCLGLLYTRPGPFAGKFGSVSSSSRMARISGRSDVASKT